MKQEIKDLIRTVKNGEHDGADLMKLCCELENQYRQIEECKQSEILWEKTMMNLVGADGVGSARSIIESMISSLNKVKEINYGSSKQVYLDINSTLEHIRSEKAKNHRISVIPEDPRNSDDFEKSNTDKVFISGNPKLKCRHKNTQPNLNYQQCRDCTGVKTNKDAYWRDAKDKWFASMNEAMFYKEYGHTPTDANDLE